LLNHYEILEIFITMALIQIWIDHYEERLMSVVKHVYYNAKSDISQHSNIYHSIKKKQKSKLYPYN